MSDIPVRPNESIMIWVSEAIYNLLLSEHHPEESLSETLARHFASYSNHDNELQGDPNLHSLDARYNRHRLTSPPDKCRKCGAPNPYVKNGRVRRTNKERGSYHVQQWRCHICNSDVVFTDLTPDDGGNTSEKP